MGTQATHEDELNDALGQLEGLETPVAGPLAKALNAIGAMLKGGKAKVDPDIDKVLDKYGGHDDEEDEEDDDTGDDGEPYDDEEDEDEDEDEDKKPSFQRGKVRKSLTEVLADEGYEAVLEADSVVGGLVSELDSRMASMEKANTRLLRQNSAMAKALLAMDERSEQMAEILQRMGGVPVTPLAPVGVGYSQRAMKSGSPSGIPNPDKLLSQAKKGLQAGIITPADKRAIELTVETGGDLSFIPTAMARLQQVPD
jgi:hypothetical protein